MRRNEVIPPEPADVVRLLEAAREYDADFGLLLLPAATTGARRGELCALRWRDLDLTVGACTIRRALTDVGGHVAEKGTKTHAAHRLRLDAATLDELRAHRRAAEERAERSSGSTRANPTRTGEMPSPSAVAFPTGRRSASPASTP